MASMAFARVFMVVGSGQRGSFAADTPTSYVEPCCLGAAARLLCAGGAKARAFGCGGGGNERQSKILDPESSGMHSQSKILLSESSGITSEVIPLHWQSSGDYWQ